MRNIAATDFVLEIGSNDGVLLLPFKNKRLKVLGVDPAANVAKIALEKGLDTVVDYFGENSAKRILKNYISA